jgi:hypothetical protein
MIVFDPSFGGQKAWTGLLQVLRTLPLSIQAAPLARDYPGHETQMISVIYILQ